MVNPPSHFSIFFLVFIERNEGRRLAIPRKGSAKKPCFLLPQSGVAKRKEKKNSNGFTLFQKRPHGSQDTGRPHLEPYRRLMPGVLGGSWWAFTDGPGTPCIGGIGCMKPKKQYTDAGAVGRTTPRKGKTGQGQPKSGNTRTEGTHQNYQTCKKTHPPRALP